MAKIDQRSIYVITDQELWISNCECCYSWLAEATSYHISMYHNVHFWSSSSKTLAPRPLNKQVSFQQCCKRSRGQCQITNASWQAVPDAWSGDSKWCHKVQFLYA